MNSGAFALPADDNVNGTIKGVLVRICNIDMDNAVNGDSALGVVLRDGAIAHRLIDGCNSGAGLHNLVSFLLARRCHGSLANLCFHAAAAANGNNIKTLILPTGNAGNSQSRGLANVVMEVCIRTDNFLINSDNADLATFRLLFLLTGSSNQLDRELLPISWINTVVSRMAFLLEEIDHGFIDCDSPVILTELARVVMNIATAELASRNDHIASCTSLIASVHHLAFRLLEVCQNRDGYEAAIGNAFAILSITQKADNGHAVTCDGSDILLQALLQLLRHASNSPDQDNIVARAFCIAAMLSCMHVGHYVAKSDWQRTIRDDPLAMQTLAALLQSAHTRESQTTGEFMLHVLCSGDANDMMSVFGYHLVAGYLYSQCLSVAEDDSVGQSGAAGESQGVCGDSDHHIPEDPVALLAKLEASGMVQVIRKSPSE